MSALCLAGCVVLDMVTGKADPGPAFPHSIHVQEEGLDCSMCHAVGDDGAPGMPAIGICNLCHEDIDQDKPPEKQAAAFFVDGVVRPGVLELGDEILFSHASHVTWAQESCEACHTGIAESERVELSQAITMDECSACHAQQGVAETCATCHSVIDTEWAPESHGQAWHRVHGQAFLAGGEGASSQCSLCHSESTCQQCHAEEAPENHTNYFRVRSHGLSASLDRQGCAVCHREDSCNRCHDDTQPLSHKGSFGSRRNNHCVTCHFPLATTGCATCHQSTPSHDQAPSQPPDHTPGANCRLCHGKDAPLRHVDDGTSCNLCHRP